MKEQGVTITETERQCLARSFQQDEGEIQQSDSLRPLSLSLLGAEESVNLLNDLNSQTRGLMKSLISPQNDAERISVIRLAKEIRETTRTKLEIAKFVHVVGDGKVKKAVRETA